MVADERRDIVALLRGLSDQEWQTPSLCDRWQVRDVVAHLASDAIAPLPWALQLLRHRLSVAHLNDDLVARARNRTPNELVEQLESTVGRGAGAALIPRVILADAVIHHQDILRPLGRQRTIPTERLISVLEHPDPAAFPWRYSRGLRFVATDIDWSKGAGPEVHGAAEALALAIAGRPIVLDELDGDGLEMLRTRMHT